MTFLHEFFQSAWGHVAAFLGILSIPVVLIVSVVRRQPLNVQLKWKPFELHMGFQPKTDDEDDSEPPVGSVGMVAGNPLDGLGNAI